MTKAQQDARAAETREKRAALAALDPHHRGGTYLGDDLAVVKRDQHLAKLADAPPTAPPRGRIYTLRTLREKGIPWTGKHIRNLVRAGKFPAPIYLSERVLVWSESMIDSWLEAKAAQQQTEEHQKRRREISRAAAAAQKARRRKQAAQAKPDSQQGERGHAP